MTTFLLWVLTLQSVAIIAWGMVRQERMLLFPFLAAGVFLGWVLPQLMGLTNHQFLPRGGLEKTIIMAILCLAATWLGFTMNRHPATLFNWRFDRGRLLWGSAVLSVLGAIFFYMVSVIAVDVVAMHGGAWTGIVTIYLFFARLLGVGMAIALILHLNRPSWPTLAIIVFDLAFYLERIIIRGRRAAMVELSLMLLMALWFQRRWRPPRWIVVFVLLAGVLLVNSIGDYRSAMMGDDRWSWSGAGVSEILEIDYTGNLQRLASGKAKSRELTNAIMNIEATDRRKLFDFGLSHWNWLVHRYVPGQLIGVDMKRAMMIEFADIGSASRNAVREFNYVPTPGSTPTGLSDAFQSFWYFGAFNFFAIGWIMSRWNAAAVRGNIAAQVILMLTVTPALHAITHSTHWFFVFFVQLSAFLVPVLVLARVRQRKCSAIVKSSLVRRHV